MSILQLAFAGVGSCLSISLSVSCTLWEVVQGVFSFFIPESGVRTEGAAGLWCAIHALVTGMQLFGNLSFERISNMKYMN